MTIKDLQTELSCRLQPLYDPREAAAIASLYVQARLGLERYELVLRRTEPVPERLLPVFRSDMERMAEGCPVQYVLGGTEFYGLPFEVSPAVLIPRPETEELVQMVTEKCKGRGVSLWDVGTGSGCIAVSLAKMLPDAAVFATDISEEALEVARRNAERNGATVDFACHDMRDIAHLPFGNTRFDVLVSNPPYIPVSDRPSMHRNVTGYEPATALFVPNDDKLWCYAAIARIGQRVLKPGGMLFVETYHDFHTELVEMFRKSGFSDVHSLHDLNGRPRFVTAVV